MKRKQYNLIHLSGIYSILILCFLITSCIAKEDIKSIMNDETHINLHVKNSRLGTISSGNSNRETRINDLAVLVFEGKGTDEIFSYRAELSGIEYIVDKNHFEVNVKLRKSVKGEKYTLVLIANHNLPKNMGYMEGISKSSALETMVYDSHLAGNNYIWYNKNNIPFPMWGETEPQIITENSTFKVVYLLRAVAKIDLGFNYELTNNGTSEFYSELLKNGEPYSLESVHLYRSKNQGAVVPFLPNISNMYESNIKVTAPTTIQSEGDDFNSPILFDGFSTTTIVNNTIYLAENVAGVLADSKTTTSLVLGLKHPSLSNMSSGVESNTRYFRADITNKDTKETLPIKRNHRYVIGIKQITGEGSKTPEEADKKHSTITITVAEWNFVSPNLIINGEQTFSISQRETTVDKSLGSSHIFNFTTNLPNHQIRIDNKYPNDIDITLDISTQTITVVTKKENTSATPITYTFDILAGQMKIGMTIKQKS